MAESQARCLVTKQQVSAGLLLATFVCLASASQEGAGSRHLGLLQRRSKVTLLLPHCRKGEEVLVASCSSLLKNMSTSFIWQTQSVLAAPNGAGFLPLWTC